MFNIPKPDLSQNKIYLRDYKTVSVNKDGFTLRLPQLSADMMVIDNLQKTATPELMPLDKGIGKKFSALI